MQLEFHPSFSLPGDQRGLTLFLQDFGGTLLQDGQVGQDGHHLVLGVGRVHPLAVPAGLQQDLDGVELQQDLAGHAVEEGDVGQSGRRQQEDLATGGALAQLCGIQSATGPAYLFIYLLAWFYFTKQQKNDTPCSNIGVSYLLRKILMYKNPVLETYPRLYMLHIAFVKVQKAHKVYKV